MITLYSDTGGGGMVWKFFITTLNKPSEQEVEEKSCDSRFLGGVDNAEIEYGESFLFFVSCLLK